MPGRSRGEGVWSPEPRTDAQREGREVTGLGGRSASSPAPARGCRMETAPQQCLALRHAGTKTLVEERL